jgi:hypothetical protein
MPPKFATYFSYADFNNGVRATLDQFREVLSTFNAISVVYVCGVMNSLIQDWQGHARLEAIEALTRNSFVPEIAEQIISQINHPHRPRGLYHRQQLLYVAKEALTLCPEVGGNDPLEPSQSRNMARALLMANDLLPKGLTGPTPTPSQMLNVMSEFIPIGEASGSYRPINKILRSRLMIERFFPGRTGDPQSIFENATGVPLDDYFALCFATLCRYVDFDFEKYQSDPARFVLSPSWYRTTPVNSDVVTNFLGEMSSSVDEFKALMAKRAVPPNDFTCFRGKPYLRNGADYLLIDPIFLAEKSDSGVFWSINQALAGNKKLQFHQDWGLAFEQYINWLISESVDEHLNRLHPNPKFYGSNEEVCDAIVVCGDSIVFVESKGATFTSDSKYGTNPAKLGAEIEEKLVGTDGRRKGIGQLALKIEEVFRRQSPRRVEGIDVSKIVKVYPVVITRDDIGSALVMNAYLASRFRELFHRKAVPITVTPPFSLSAQDIEMLCAYLRSASLADLLEERYRAEPALLSSFWLVDHPITTRLGDRECRALEEIFHAYCKDIGEKLFPGQEI